MKYYTIAEIESIEKPYKKGCNTIVIKDYINDVAFFKFEKSKETLEIEDLKQKLFDTDYQAIKYAEGQISEEDYVPIKEQRQAWRDRINELESEV